MKNNITVEICTGSISDVITAAKVPEVDRIELNSALQLGGLTPSLSTFRQARRLFTGEIVVMVRPRPAGFAYNRQEKANMLEDAAVFLNQGADGIVFGCLDKDHAVDKAFTAKMCGLIHGCGKTAVFHKAFDATADQIFALEDLIACGVDRVLTSGGQADALTGATLIRRLCQIAKNRMTVLPGGGISEDNVARIIRLTGCRQIHMSAKVTHYDDQPFLAVDKKRIRAILDRIPS